MKNVYRQEISLNDTIEIIYQAWYDCQQLIEISQDRYNNIELKPEYLVTVKIIDRIIKQFIETPSSNFAVKLEERTKNVFERCFQDLTRVDVESKRIKFKPREKKESIKRKGKFDVTIYKKNNFSKIDSYRTYCVIEIKNFETSYKKIKSDLDRIQELICCTDNDVSQNSCQYGILTFSIKLNKKMTRDALFDNKLDQIIDNKKANIIKHLDIDDNNNVFIDIKYLYDKSDYEEMDLSYVFLIVMIIVKPKN